MGTLTAWSGAMFWLGVALQVGLLATLVRRRLASEVWVLSALLLFYAVRSVVLHGLAHRMPRDASEELYSGLSLADFVLQAGLAGELLTIVVRRGRRLMTGAGALLLAAGAAAGIVALLPSRSPVPADRGTILFGVLFAILFVIAASQRQRGWVSSIMRGMAVVGLSGALAECGKSVAAFHRDGHAFVAWSYANAAVYIMALLYWIVVSRRRGREAEPATQAEGLYARGTI